MVRDREAGSGLGTATADAMRKPVRWSLHALDGLIARTIDRAEADRVIETPEFVVPDEPTREVYMRRYVDVPLGREMLLRVVIEETNNEWVVVTVSKTSQLRKYPKGIVP